MSFYSHAKLTSTDQVGAVKHGGVGHHIEYWEDNNPEVILIWRKYLVAISTLYPLIVNIPKLAILALYHRLFPIRNTRLIIYILAAILITSSFSSTIVTLAACKPFSANWDRTIEDARCINKKEFFIWSTFPNILTDVAMLVLPLPIIWQLHTNTRMKVGLTLTLLFGTFGLVTSILRFQMFFENNTFTDGTYKAVELLILTQAEPGAYLIAACLPTYRPLLEKLGIGKFTVAIFNVQSRRNSEIVYNKPQGRISYTASAEGSRNMRVEQFEEIALRDQNRDRSLDVYTKGGFYDSED